MGLRPLIVVSDVHLGHGRAGAVATGLAQLIEQHSGHEVVLNGDTFDLSWDPRGRDPAESATSMLAPHAELRRALTRHLRAGHRVTVLAGNHDADIQRPSVRDALVAQLGCAAGTDFRIEPWFVRRGPVHVEHGHVFDPDNAPAHPLAPPRYRSEPVGVAICRRFLAPNADVAMTNRQDATPLENLRDALRLLGPRAPGFLARYVATLVGITAETLARSRLTAELAAGTKALERRRSNTATPGVDRPTTQLLLDARPHPTHTSFLRTFMRLYFDRIAATTLVAGGLAASPLAGATAGAGLTVPALLYLIASTGRGRNRYTNRMPDSLRAGARVVRRITGAQLVTFGHTHTDDAEDGYLNSAAFGDPPSGGRPFIRVSEAGTAERRLLPFGVPQVS